MEEYKKSKWLCPSEIYSYKKFHIVKSIAAASPEKVDLLKAWADLDFWQEDADSVAHHHLHQNIHFSPVKEKIKTLLIC